MLHGWDFGLIAFVAAAALATFAVARGIWRIARGSVELEAGGSWGGQLSGSKRTVLVNAALVVLVIAIAVAVVWSF
jgi:uncharacterized protein YndB with AHSA1/START domain